MPNIFQMDKISLVDMLKRKNQVLLTYDGKIITPEDLEDIEDIEVNNCYIDLHA